MLALHDVEREGGRQADSCLVPSKRSIPPTSRALRLRSCLLQGPSKSGGAAGTHSSRVLQASGGYRYVYLKRNFFCLADPVVGVDGQAAGAGAGKRRAKSDRSHCRTLGAGCGDGPRAQGGRGRARAGEGGRGGGFLNSSTEPQLGRRHRRRGMNPL